MSMYANVYMSFSCSVAGEYIIDTSGVSIIVRKPFEISDIILAIFFLSIVNCNSKSEE